MFRELFVPAAVVFFLTVAAWGAAGPISSGADSTMIVSDVPAQPDPSARYVIYLHGAIIETQGVRPTHPRFGVYEYQEILSTVAERGSVVISEARPSGTDVVAYAERVANQVRTLVGAGVPPENITVVGFSKGGVIAILASSLLADDRVGFVFIAACGPWIESRPEIVPHGRILALREVSDELVGSCDPLFARAGVPAEHREVEVEIGGGHGAFYRPHPEWVDPLVEWANPER